MFSGCGRKRRLSLLVYVAVTVCPLQDTTILLSNIGDAARGLGNGEISFADILPTLSGCRAGGWPRTPWYELEHFLIT